MRELETGRFPTLPAVVAHVERLPFGFAQAAVMSAGCNKNSLWITGIDGDGVNVAIQLLVEELPACAAIRGFQDVADLQGGINGF